MASASDADLALLQELIDDNSGDEENGFTLADVDAHVAEAAIPRDDELAKQRRATNAKEKAARARALVPANLRAPRPLAVLRRLDWSRELVCGPAADGILSTTVASRAEAHLLMAELSETKGACFITSGRQAHPCSAVKPETTLYGIRGVCTLSSCPFMFAFVNTDLSWELKEFVDHCENCNNGEDNTEGNGAAPKRRLRRTAYEASELVRVVVDSQSGAQIKITPAVVKALLGAFTSATPSYDLANRVCQAAIEALRGKPADNFAVRVFFSFIFCVKLNTLHPNNPLSQSYCCHTSIR
jgi:hypothetical protein